ncbi:sensor histidine kinase [Acuticoccus sp. I52.16.1]|uniref:sensor histidine kinase n=1 Tax=Acuticoccus sp. I52.16.1 TaxID=2928472 RepID=UPI001FD38D32|nr:PAS domain-containing protein [Acuticoccus sp. I52.16.1]UOM35579.1 PAS domain-containing protein [Acuticoccus sp. I52.16.1]
MVDVSTFNYCFPTSRCGVNCPALPADLGETYLEHEFEVARRSGLYGRMLREGVLTDGLWFWDLLEPDNCYISPGFWRALGFAPSTRPPLMAHWRALVFEEDLAAFEEKIAAHLANPATPYDQVLRCRTADGATLRVRSRGVALFEDGAPRRMSGTFDVLGDMREDVLSDKMSEVLELSQDAISVWCMRRGVRRWNRGAEAMFGFTAEEMQGEIAHERMWARFSSEWPEILATIERGRSWTGEAEWHARSGRTVYTSTTLQRMAISGGDTLVLQVDRDVTAKVELRERQRVMTRELNHRVKNLFAVIRALVKLSSLGQDHVPALVRELDQRIAALAAAHVVSLGYEMEDGAPLGEVLEAVLAPYPASRAALELDGPSQWLPQSRITPMGLILNELATNALKHGAWSSLEGRVSVRWERVHGDGAELIRLTWEEISPSFRPSGTEATRRGFGSELIEMSTAQMGAVLSRSEGRAGVRLTLTFEAGVQVGAAARAPTLQPTSARSHVP